MSAKSFRTLPGDYASNVVLHVPHSSIYVPPNVRSGLLLNDPDLEHELLRMTDRWIDEITAIACQHATAMPWTFVNQLSRLVIDPNTS